MSPLSQKLAAILLCFTLVLGASPAVPAAAQVIKAGGGNQGPSGGSSGGSVSGAWETFVVKSGPALSQPLQIDLSNAGVAFHFVKVMNQTATTPAELQDKPVEAQAAFIQAAVGAYAEKVFAAAEAKVSVGQLGGALGSMHKLVSLQAIKGALSQSQKQTLETHAQTLGQIGVDVEKLWKKEKGDGFPDKPKIAGFSSHGAWPASPHSADTFKTNLWNEHGTLKPYSPQSLSGALPPSLSGIDLSDTLSVLPENKPAAPKTWKQKIFGFLNTPWGADKGPASKTLVFGPAPVPRKSWKEKILNFLNTPWSSTEGPERAAESIEPKVVSPSGVTLAQFKAMAENGTVVTLEFTTDKTPKTGIVYAAANDQWLTLGIDGNAPQYQLSQIKKVTPAGIPLALQNDADLIKHFSIGGLNLDYPIEAKMVVVALLSSSGELSGKAGQALSKWTVKNDLPKDLHAAVMRALGHGAAHVRANAVKALGIPRHSYDVDKDQVGTIAALLSDPDLEVRRSAAVYLAYTRFKHNYSLGKTAAKRFKAMLSDGDLQLRLLAAVALGAEASWTLSLWDEAIPALEHEDPELRRYAHDALRQRKSLPNAAVDALVRVLANQDKQIRRRALELLTGSYESYYERHLEALVTMLGNPETKIAEAAQERLSYQEKMPEAIIRLLYAAAGKDDEAGARAAKVITEGASRWLPIGWFKWLLHDVMGGDTARAETASGMLKNISIQTSEQKEAVLKALEAAQGAPQAQLLEIAERFATAQQLFAIIHPAQAAEFAQLVPVEMPGAGFGRSTLASREGAARLMARLRDFRSRFSAEDYEAFIRGGKLTPGQIGDILERRVILSLGRPQFLSKDGRYRLPYKVPWVAGEAERLAGLFATVNAPPSKAPGIERAFEDFNALIDANNRALQLMAQNAGAMTKAAARGILKEVSRMVDAYDRLDTSISKKGVVAAKLKSLTAEYEALWAALPEKDVLPAAVAQRLTEFETSHPSLEDLKNLNTFINHVHQASFDKFNKVAQNTSEGSGSLAVGDRKLSLLNLGERPLVENGRLENILKMIAIKNLPRGNAIVRDDEVWIHTSLGVHSAEIHVKLSEPDEGGFFKINYSDSGSDQGSQVRMFYLTEVLRHLGAAHSKIEGSYFSASWDKDHGLLSKAQLEYAMPILLDALVTSLNMDLTFGSYVRKLGFDEMKQIAASMASSFVAEGKLTFYEGDGDLNKKYKAYLKGEGARNEVRLGLNVELKRLGLPEIPLDLAFGQQVIEDRFAKPVELALARGELMLDADGLPKRAPYDPVTALAQALSQDAERALDVAAVMPTIDPGILRFEAIGAIGHLRAERAQHGAIVLYVLRDAQSGAVAYARAQRSDGRVLEELGAAQLVDALKAAGVDASAGHRAGAIQERRRRRLLKSPPAPAESGTVVSGLAASSGRGSFVSGPIAFRKEGGTIETGSIFLTPFTTPDDLANMRRSAAVVTTGGGLLSHAAITTREFGLPAVIVPSAKWSEKSGDASVGVEIERPGAAAQGPGGLWLVNRIERQKVALRAGDIVRVDGVKGTMTLFNDEAVRQAHERLSEIRARRLDAKPLADWLKKLAAAPQLASAKYILEEALWNREHAQAKDDILKALLEASPALTDKLRAYGEELLSARVTRVAQETSVSDEASIEDVRALAAERVELSALAEILQLRPGSLRPIDERLAVWQGLAQTVKRNADELVASALAAWSSRAQETLSLEDLPGLRLMLRRTRDAGAKPEVVAALQTKALELARAKKAAVLASRPAVLPLDRVDDDFTEIVGGKSAKLGEIMQVVLKAGGYVPQGLAVTTEAYLRFLKESGLEARINQEARELDEFLAHSDLNQESTIRFIEERSERIQSLLKSARLSAEEGVGKEIVDALKARGLEKEVFAVRSSAVQEDREEAAFAGAAETYLYVGFDAVLEKVVENWSSFWLPRGIQYRWAQGIKSIELLPAVAVQKMANPQAAGVMFTVNPVTRKPEIVINAAFGLGEGIVSGLVQADQYTVNRLGEELASPVLGHKKVKVVRRPDGHGTEVKTVALRERRKAALKPEQIAALAKVGAALEDYFGYPLDIEWVVEDGKVAIVQARPVTVSGAKPAGPGL